MNVTKETEDLLVTLENTGEIAGPITISGIKDGQSMAPIWIEGFKGEKTIRYLNSNYDHIRIDYNGDMPETNRNNNIMRTKGVFRKCEPLKLQILGSMYHPEKTQIFFHPNMSWNKYNTYSVGLSMYNRFIPKGGFSYKLSPMYSLGTQELVGRGNLAFTKYSHSSIFSKVKLGIDAERYNYSEEFAYNKIVPSLTLILNENNLRSKRESSIKISSGNT